jgi:hypothetical protein
MAATRAPAIGQLLASTQGLGPSARAQTDSLPLASYTAILV